MLSQTLRLLYARDLAKLIEELEQYQREENLWRISKDILNSSGNLCLHIIGNLSTYIGAELGGTGYIRNRPAEFALKNVPRQELVQQITTLANTVDQVLGSLTEQQIAGDYPQPYNGNIVSTEYFLVHLATHLSYHLGQVNYHRRLLDS